MIAEIKNLVIVGLVSLLLGASIAGFGAWHYTSKADALQYQAQTDKLNQKATDKEAELVKQKNKAELDLANARGTIDNEYKDTIAGFKDNIAKLTADNIRLHDPGVKTSHTAAGSDPTKTDDTPGTASTEGLLSGQATQFLYGYALDADSTLEKLRVCEVWTDKVQLIINSQQKKSASGN